MQSPTRGIKNLPLISSVDERQIFLNSLTFAIMKIFHSIFEF